MSMSRAGVLLARTLLEEEVTEPVQAGRACKYLTNIIQREQWYFLLLPGLGVEAKHWSKSRTCSPPSSAKFSLYNLWRVTAMGFCFSTPPGDVGPFTQVCGVPRVLNRKDKVLL